MDAALRRRFDAVLDQVLQELPEMVHRLLDEVPLYVDDHPSRQLMRRLHLHDRRQLCGLYTGIPLGQRSIEHSGVLSDAVHLFREGILALATDRRGRINARELQRQIRITVLHELGHLHGLSEAELRALGY